jgi:glycosyltransferase involved in cell wall biosynthesis
VAGALGVSATLWLVGGEDMHLRIPFAAQLRERGFSVSVVSSGAAAPFAAHGLAHHAYPLARLVDPLADLRALCALKRLLRAHRPDLVHGFDTKPSLLVPLACARAGVGAAVRTINGMGYVFSEGARLGPLLRPAYAGLQRLVRRATAATVFQNAQDRAYFLAHGFVDPRRARLIPGSGIDLDAFRARVPPASALGRLRAELAPGGEAVVVTISRLTRQKGVEGLLRAAADVRRRRRDVVFLLVGPRDSEGWLGVDDATLEAYARDVHWLGPRDDVPALLAAADLCVLPTRYREGVPRVLLEAGAVGCPVVATALPGCVDVVADGRNGLLVPPGDDRALAVAVERLLDEPDARRAMGRRHRAVVESRFAMPGIVEAYASLYREVLAASQVSAAAA